MYAYSYQQYHLFLEIKEKSSDFEAFGREWDMLLRELWFKAYLQHNFMISNWLWGSSSSPRPIF